MTAPHLTLPFPQLSVRHPELPAQHARHGTPPILAPQGLAGDVRLSERLSSELLALLEHYCAAHRHELNTPLSRHLAFTATVALPVSALPFLNSESLTSVPTRAGGAYLFCEWQMTRPVEHLTHLHGVAGHGVTSALYSRALAQVRAGKSVSVLARDLDAPLWKNLPGALMLSEGDAVPRDLPRVTVVLSPSCLDSQPVTARKWWTRWRGRLTSEAEHVYADSVISRALCADPRELNEYAQKANFTLGWNHVKNSALGAALEHMNQGQGAALILRSRQPLTLLAQDR